MHEKIKFFRGGIFQTDKAYRHISRIINSTELIIVTGGALYMEIAGERFSARQGDTLLIRPGEAHGGFEDSSEVSFIWMHFDGADDAMLPKRYSTPKSYDRVILLASEVIHYARTTGYPKGITECLLCALLAEVCYKGEDEGSLVASIKSWIGRRGMTGVTAGEVAQKFGYNPDYLNRAFKEALGVGLKEYISSVRLDYIKGELLVGGCGLAEIGERCGFSDYKSFLKFFKYHAGMTPSEYRAAYYQVKRD